MKLFLLSTSAMFIVNAALTAGAHDYTNTHVQAPEQAIDVSEVQFVVIHISCARCSNCIFSPQSLIIG